MADIKRTQSLSVAKHIEKSQKKVTVLFTDIVDSTKFWEKVGDVEARVQVDLHNRVLFSVIKQYKGKILKTIGDAIMASFKSPDNALKAAIGCQQILRRERTEHNNFNLHIRIGIHSGRAIIEDKDVFGDVVNVAARVEGEAEKDEICISKKTQEVLKKEFPLKRGGSFLPKGKKKKLMLYQVQWEKSDSLIGGVRVITFMPSNKNQRIAVSVSLVVTLIWLYYLYSTSIRFFLADIEWLSIMLLDPFQGAREYPYLVFPFLGAALIGLYKLVNYSHLSLNLFRALKGGMYGAVAYLIATLLFIANPTDILQSDLITSNHLFVEVLEPDTDIKSRPRLSATTLKRVHMGDLLLLTDIEKRGVITWNKVLIAPKQYGWVPRVVPARMGIPKKRYSKANNYRYTTFDLYALLVGVLGWVFGWFSFRIKPV
ncbi:MAG: adenylate/guanylate cyclase domain-containing protein [Fibrobacterales bacterium]